MKFSLGSTTDLGRRQNNEDSHAIVDVAGLGIQAEALLIIADGMGGRNFGEHASQAAVEAVIETMTEKLSVSRGAVSPAIALKTALHRANDAVYELSRRDEESEGMGTTCVVALISDGRLCIGHAGDSRAYALYKGRLEQLTDDHSFVAEQVRSGMISEEKARKSRFRNVITRAVGIEPTIEPDVVEYPLEGIDALVLCTDGLSNIITDRDIERILLTCTDAQTGADRLVKMAKQAGGSDNITAIVAHFGEGPIMPALEDDPDMDEGGKPKRQNAKFPPTNLTSILSLVLLLLFGFLTYTSGQLLKEGYNWGPLPPFLLKPPPALIDQHDLAHVKYEPPAVLLQNPVRPEPLVVTPNGKAITAVLEDGDLINLTPDGTTLYRYPWSYMTGPSPTHIPGADLVTGEDTTNGRGSPSNWHIATDIQGNLYIADAAAHTITKYKPSGDVLGVIRETGNGGPTTSDLCPDCDNLVAPESIAVDAAGDIYVVDGSNLKVLRAVPSK